MGACFAAAAASIACGESGTSRGNEPDTNVDATPAQEPPPLEGPHALPDWNAIFFRDGVIGGEGGQRGWRSSDGGWSVALPRVQGGPPTERTLWLFGDTAVYNEATATVNDFNSGPIAFRNTLAVHDTGGAPPWQAPGDDQITFYGRALAGSSNAGQVIALNDTSEGVSWTESGVGVDPFVTWRWPGAALYVEATGSLYMTWLERTTEIPNQCFEAHATGVRAYVYQVDNPEAPPEEWDSTLAIHELVDAQGESPYPKNLHWGSALLYDPEEDWLYVYGVTVNDMASPCAPIHESPGFAKDTILARARPNEIGDYTRWQFWNGDWSSVTPAGPGDLAVVARVGQSEISVDRVTLDGVTQYVLVQGRGLSEEDVVVRLSNELTHFDDVDVGYPSVWTVDPKITIDPGIFTAEQYLAVNEAPLFPNCAALTTAEDCGVWWHKCAWNGSACETEPEFELWIWAVKGHLHLGQISGTTEGDNWFPISYYPEVYWPVDGTDDPCSALDQAACDRAECFWRGDACISWPVWGRVRFFGLDLNRLYPWCTERCWNCAAADCSDVR